jgi:hypothetical protein
VRPVITGDQPLVRLLSIEEYAAPGETEHGYTELREGRLVVSPNPRPQHNRAIFELAKQLEPQLPGELGYQDAPAVTGVFATTEPFPVKLDLTA